MIHPNRPLLTAALAAALMLGASPEKAHGQRETAEATHLGRALDRAVLRVQRRADLRSHRGAGFDRDSFDVQAFIGLGRVEDSVIVGWFTGFSEYVQGTDSVSCGRLTEEDPTGSALARVPSTMDSASVERWVGLWEVAVAASYLSSERPPVNEEELMVAIFALIAKLPESQITSISKPSDKPRKANPERECLMLRGFFEQALALEEPTRMTLLRGMASMMDEGKGRLSTGGE